MKKNIFMVIVLILVLAMLSYVGYGFYKKVTEEVKNPVVTLEIENQGTVKMELYPDMAPNTVKNFIRLVQNGYYNGKTFFGIDTNAVYAGRNGDGEIENAKLSNIGKSSDSEDYEYQINGEFVANNYEENTLRHEKGIVSMARNDYSQYMSNLTVQSYNSANSQFSILLNDERGYNGLYAAFGKVIEGLEIIENFKNLETKVEEGEDAASSESTLKNFAQMPKITNATVETYGVDYGEPEVEKAFDYQNYIYNYYSQQYAQ